MSKRNERTGADHGEGPVRVVEKRGFAHAQCDCGWRGPARRSRKKAREDAAAHREERCKAVRGK